MKRMAVMLSLTLAVGMGLGVALAQLAPPTKVTGRTEQTLASLDPTAQIRSIEGQILRVRQVTYEPGGKGTLHSHKERPVISYVLEGTFTECLEGDACKDFHEGQTKAHEKDVIHWVENRGTKPLKIIDCEIAKKP